jgi:hypothetical protein
MNAPGEGVLHVGRVSALYIYPYIARRQKIGGEILIML